MLFSLSALSGRRLTDYLSGSWANLARLLLAAACLGTYAHLFGFGIRGPGFLLLFVSGCIGFGMGDLAMFQAYPRIGTRRTLVLVQCLAAPIAALTEWAWLGTAPSIWQALFGLVILTGVGLALMPRCSEKNACYPHGIALGCMFGGIAALGQGWGAVLSRKAYAVSAAQDFAITGASGGINAAYQRLLGGLFVTVLFMFYQKYWRTPGFVVRTPQWSRAWPLVVANGLGGPALGVACYQWALSTTPTGVVLPIVAVAPLVVMPFAHYMEGDRITRRAVIGALLAVAGVIGLTLVG